MNSPATFISLPVEVVVYFFGKGSIQDIEDYFAAVVENESGMLPFAATGDRTGGFERIGWTQPNQLVFIANTDLCYQYTGSTDAPESSSFEYKWFRDDAMDYYALMKKWNDMGFWSKNAISNTEQVRDAFENGKSSSLTWNTPIFLAAKNLVKNNPEWTYEALDINPDTIRTQALYTNDCIAIAAASKNPERAAMFVDLAKNDMDIYLKLVGGIEGTHYILNENGTRTAGPDAEKYPWNPSTWCFNRTPGAAPEDADTLPGQLTFEAEQLAKAVNPATTAFRFDVEPVKSELAALDALRDEICPTLNLGMVEDIDATVADWKAKAEAAGLNTVMDEFTKQYDAWKASL
ncbi:MAG: DUF3502 domain-containing protein [Oscillospiraceae bacterium]